MSFEAAVLQCMQHCWQHRGSDKLKSKSTPHLGLSCGPALMRICAQVAPSGTWRAACPTRRFLKLTGICGMHSPVQTQTPKALCCSKLFLSKATGGAAYLKKAAHLLSRRECERSQSGSVVAESPPATRNGHLSA